ncbi:S-type pyocin [Pseudomonas parafulva]|uniref:S-type pyocin n=1 Tax=Pseudomonas parafulva TaxID=157782 RepID=UPI0035637DB5
MATPIPTHIAQKLAGHHFTSFDQFSSTFWMTIAEDPVLSKQFVESQLNRIKKGWAPRAPFGETATGLRSYQICHLLPPALSAVVYDMDNMRIMSALQYARSSEVEE